MEQIIGISSQLARLSQVAASQLFPIDHGLVLVLTIWPHFFLFYYYYFILQQSAGQFLTSWSVHEKKKKEFHTRRNLNGSL